MPKLLRTLAVATASAVLVAGCGGNPPLTKSRYEQRVNQIGKQLATTLSDTFSSPKLRDPNSLKDAADVIRAGQKNIRDAADRLDELNAPEQIAGIHDRLAKGFRDFATAFGGFARATEKGDLPSIQQFSRQVSDQTLPAMVEIQEAIDALKARGFDISNG